MTEIQKNSFSHPLFEAVQLNRIFPDGKTFVDCRPKQSYDEILDAYYIENKKPGFDLKQFVLNHFDLPVPHSVHYSSDPTKPVASNIESLWDVLTREPDTEKGSLIPLPFPYVVPGGRFGEIYYWDSYFTMLGLKTSGRYDMIENMIGNFSYLIDTLGYIPNGNRTYFIGRSQPPFYAQMIKLLADKKGYAIYLQYLPQLEKEYQFWMKGAAALNEKNKALFHCVLMPDGSVMNRYKDEWSSPRPESYREDVELVQHTTETVKPSVYGHLRAGAESGWDFSSRWFKKSGDFSSIHCTDIIPVDLNCLLLNLEQTLAHAYALKGETGHSIRLVLAADKRKKAIEKYCWNESAGFYMDVDWVEGNQKTAMTLGGISALYFKLADNQKAERIQEQIRSLFLKEGGVVTTLEATGQQWDAPNGWAPLQWMTIKGLENYGFTKLAADIARRWIRLNTAVFKRTGKLMEKYNVVDTHLEAGGGEYEGQDGFGWTNGVLLALISHYGQAE